MSFQRGGVFLDYDDISSVPTKELVRRYRVILSSIAGSVEVLADADESESLEEMIEFMESEKNKYQVLLKKRRVDFKKMV